MKRFCVKCGKEHAVTVENVKTGELEDIDVCMDCLMSTTSIVGWTHDVLVPPPLIIRRGQMNWINIKDRFPERDQDVLLYNGREVGMGQYFHGDCCGRDVSHWIVYQDDYDDISHWMPLPNPPEDK